MARYAIVTLGQLRKLMNWSPRDIFPPPTPTLEEIEPARSKFVKMLTAARAAYDEYRRIKTTARASITLERVYVGQVDSGKIRPPIGGESGRTTFPGKEVPMAKKSKKKSTSKKTTKGK